MNPRTCIGCRRRDDAAAMVRLVWDADGESVTLDRQLRRPGRGAWIHAQRPACRAEAARRNALARALRRRLPAQALEAALDPVTEPVTEPDRP